MLEEIAQKITEEVVAKAHVPVSGTIELPEVITLQSFFKEPSFFAVVNLVGFPQDCFKNLISLQFDDPNYLAEYPINKIPIAIKLLIRTYASTRDEVDDAAQRILDSLGHELKVSVPGIKSGTEASCSIKLKKLNRYSREGSLATLDIVNNENTAECIIPLDYSAIDVNCAPLNHYTLNELLCAYIHYQHLISRATPPESTELQNRIEQISKLLGPALSHAGNALISLEGLKGAYDYVRNSN